MPVSPENRSLLFIGDSLTYFNDLDYHVKEFAEAAYPNVVFKFERTVKGGAPLKALWRKTDAKKRIAEGCFGAVILQEDLPETNVAAFHEYAKCFHEVAKGAGSMTVLLMTWPYKRLGWISTQGIADAHSDIACQLGATVVPAALAWERAMAARPGIDLYAQDKEHPSPRGTYLAAATVFASLWDHSPIGLETQRGMAVGNKQMLAFLQQVAWETVQCYKANVVFPAADSKLNSRGQIVADLFCILDGDKDDMLSYTELWPFEEFVGGDSTYWKNEFVALCEEVGCKPDTGICLKGFTHLVDMGTQNGLYSTDCTTDELSELLQACKSNAVGGCGNPTAAKRATVVIVPGNGGGDVMNSNWYGWFADELRKLGVVVRLQNMPDPVYAREKNWLPFIVNTLAGGEENLSNTIVVGHSSGAAAAMRLAEQHTLFGVVLVAAYTSHMGNSVEKKSGYFNRPWEWCKQKSQCSFIVQFASTDDPFLPMKEQHAVRDGLAPKVEYFQFDGKSHFFDYPFPELLDVVCKKMGF